MRASRVNTCTYTLYKYAPGTETGSGVAKVRKKIRRGKRRKCKQFYENNDNKWTLFHLNIRGLKSKQKALNAIVGQLRPSVITSNETHLMVRQKPELSNYKSFN